METQSSGEKRSLNKDAESSNKRRKKSNGPQKMSAPRGSGSMETACMDSRPNFCSYLRSLNPCRRRRVDFYPLPALKVKSPFHRIMYIMRGPPGCGKSTAARNLWAQHMKLGGLVCRAGDRSAPEVISRAFIFSTDDYFTHIDESGRAEYEFNPKNLGSNHEKNRQRCETAMELGVSPIFVDNTNINLWEMRGYVLLADRFGYEVEVVDPNSLSPTSLDVDTLVRRCDSSSRTSGKIIPREVLQRMVSNFTSLTGGSGISDPLDEVRAAKGPERRKARPLYAGLDVEPQLLAALGTTELGQDFWEDLHGSLGNYSDARGLQDPSGAFGADSPEGPFRIPARLHVTVQYFGGSDASLKPSQELVGIKYCVVISALIFIRGGGLLCAPCSIMDESGEMPFELQELANEGWRPHVTLLTRRGGEWQPVDSTAILKAWEEAVLSKCANVACESSAVVSSDPYEDNSTSVFVPSDPLMTSDVVSAGNDAGSQVTTSFSEASVDEQIGNPPLEFRAAATAQANADCQPSMISPTKEVSLAQDEPSTKDESPTKSQEASACQQNESPPTTVIDPSESQATLDAADQNKSACEVPTVEHEHMVPSEICTTEGTTSAPQLAIGVSGCASSSEVYSAVKIKDSVVDLCAIHLPAPIILTSCPFRLFWK